jgi:hypothetical protein
VSFFDVIIRGVASIVLGERQTGSCLLTDIVGYFVIVFSYDKSHCLAYVDIYRKEKEQERRTRESERERERGGSFPQHETVRLEVRPIGGSGYSCGVCQRVSHVVKLMFLL